MSLNYDSGAGNGPFGIGWQFSVPSITRKTAKGIPRYFAGDEQPDTFLLSGAEDLVPVPMPAALKLGDDQHDVQLYRPRVEGLFARIERWTRKTDGDVHWRVTTRDNMLNIYGRSLSARIADPQAKGTAPDKPAEGRDARVFSWLLEETRDDRGNIAVYTYKKEDGGGLTPRLSERSRFANNADGSLAQANGAPVLEANAQRYLSRVRYGNVNPVGRNDPAPTDDDDWLFEVVFDYGEYDRPKYEEPEDRYAALAPDPGAAGTWEARLDPFSTHRSGFEIRTYRLCRRVLVFHRFGPNTEGLTRPRQLVRSTDFFYDEGPVVTYLASVVHAGYDTDTDVGSYKRATLPGLELSYARVPDEFDSQLRSISPESLEGIPSGVDGAQHRWVDLDGEGLPGVLSAEPRAWSYKRNEGGGSLAPPRRLSTLPSPAERQAGALLTDLGGDGQLDVVTYTPPLSGYFARTEDGGWDPFRYFQSLPNVDWADPNLRFIDLNGDGHPDVLISEHDAFVWYRSRAKEGLEVGGRVAKSHDEVKGPTAVFSDGTETIFVADLSGDGLSDIARIRNGEVSYWPALGYGRFGRKVTLEGSPRFDSPGRFDPKRIRLADLDGSGTTDILYLSRDGVDVYLNQSGNSLAPARRLTALPPVDSLTQFSTVDLLGKGMSCLVWSSPLRQGQPVLYVDPLGNMPEECCKPHVLTETNNNLGARTRLRYTTSTKHYLDDRKAGRPWLTRLAFPVHVLDQVEHYDEIGKTRIASRFKYHHGYFDGHEREFRGFACVEQTDTETIGGDKGQGLFPEFPYDQDPNDPALNLPPVRTVTWFHTGAWLRRESLEAELALEYYQGDATAPKLPDTRLPEGLSIKEQREAARALRGKTLRQEVYADDPDTEPNKAPHPYTVRESSFALRKLHDASDAAHAVFFSHLHESIQLQYERNPEDPRMVQDLVLDVDEFGNVRQSGQIAYPRRLAHRDPDVPEQAELRVVVTQASFINLDARAEGFRIGLPVESLSWELTGWSVPEAPGDAADPSSPRWRARDTAELAEAFVGSTPRDYEAPPSQGARQRRLVNAQVSQYLSDTLLPAPLGETGLRALPFETYRLALTRGLVTAHLDHDDHGRPIQITDQWLKNEGKYVLGSDLPGPGVGFASLLPQALPQADSWWAPSGHVVYSGGVPAAAADFFRPRVVQDPFGGDHTVDYDTNRLLVVESSDPISNITKIKNNYRVLAPAWVRDLNENRAAVEFDALGMVVATAVMGKKDAGEGDTLADPTTKFTYDLHAWRTDRKPASATVSARETHQDPNTRWLVSHNYSDGFGREVMRKVQAEPGDAHARGGNGVLLRNPNGTLRDPVATQTRWVGTGRTVFNNKGQPIKQYEPFFSSTKQFEDEADLTDSGVTPVLRYDPLGRLVRTDLPNGTFTKVEFDPWSQTTWDENDTVRQSAWWAAHGSPEPGSPEPTPLGGGRDRTARCVVAKRRAAWLAAHHADTPTTIYLDSLGRPVRSVVLNKLPGEAPRQYVTKTELDIEGNQLSVTDARGLTVLRQRFDLLGRPIHTASPDAGARWRLSDVAGKPVRTWDSLEHETQLHYDQLQRPTKVEVKTRGQTAQVVQRTLYGDAEGAPGAAANLRGKVHLSYDGAGAHQHLRYDFNGNLEESRRRLFDYRGNPGTRLSQQNLLGCDWTALADTTLSPVATAAAAEALLENETFVRKTEHDALSRPVRLVAPDGSETVNVYNDAGLLESVSAKVAGKTTTYIQSIATNARGQRELIVYGNNTRTRYWYDDETFRLARVRTERSGDFPDDCDEGSTLSNSVLQDLYYAFDPVGNVVEVEDYSQQRVFYCNTVVDPVWRYAYDATYQLIKSTGREHPGQQPTHDDKFQNSLPHHNDPSAVRNYVEQYSYDEVGNIQAMDHDSDLSAGQGDWKRRYRYEIDSQGDRLSNKLVATSVAGDASHEYSAKYEHDDHGNMIKMPHLNSLVWDHADQLVQAGNDDGMTAYYGYDGAGERVRKLVDKGGIVEERIYLDGFEVYRRRGANGVELERRTLHVMDQESRVALVETKTRDGGNPIAADARQPRHRFQLANHLGSIQLELSDDGRVISYAEYYPFGRASYQSARQRLEVERRRYRYNGKEIDEETGLHYYGARYFAAWLGRWTAADPAGLIEGTSLFVYARNSPVVGRDMDGRFSDPTGLFLAGKAGGGATGASAAAANPIGLGLLALGTTVWAGIVWSRVARTKRQLQNTRKEAADLAAQVRDARANYGRTLLENGDIDDEQYRLFVETGALSYVVNESASNAARQHGVEHATGSPQRVQPPGLRGTEPPSAPAPETDAREAWNLEPRERGRAIERHLAKTEYRGWFNVGSESRRTPTSRPDPFFPLVDFQKGKTLVSLKSVDTRGKGWKQRLRQHIDALGDNGATVDDVEASMVLDVRVQPGGRRAADSLVEYGRKKGVEVRVSEFDEPLNE